MNLEQKELIDKIEKFVEKITQEAAARELKIKENAEKIQKLKDELRQLEEDYEKRYYLTRVIAKNATKAVDFDEAVKFLFSVNKVSLEDVKAAYEDAVKCNDFENGVFVSMSTPMAYEKRTVQKEMEKDCVRPSEVVSYLRDRGYVITSNRVITLYKDGLILGEKVGRFYWISRKSCLEYLRKNE